jgi:hypothetical protein
MKGHIEEETIALLAGDDLSTRKALDVTRHLAGCPACSAKVERYRAGRHEMAALRGADIGAADFEDVRRSVLTRLRYQSAPRFRVGTFVRWGAASAVILTAATTGVMWRREIPATHSTRGSMSATEAPSGRIPGPDKIEAPRDIRPTAAAEVHLGSARKAPKHSTAPNREARSVEPFTLPPVESAQVEARPALDRVAIKMETPDTNVIIIWLACSEGKEK